MEIKIENISFWYMSKRRKVLEDGRVAHHSVSPFGRPKLTAMALST